MRFSLCEPSLAEALADPVIVAAMAADGIDPHDFETVLREQARKIGARRTKRSGEREPVPCQW